MGLKIDWPFDHLVDRVNETRVGDKGGWGPTV